MTSALASCERALTEAAVSQRRQRLRNLGALYSRERDLIVIAPSLSTNPMSPRLGQLRPGARNDSAATTAAILFDLANRLRLYRTAQRRGRNVGIEIDALCQAMVGEARILRRQRAAAIAQAMTDAGYRPAEE